MTASASTPAPARAAEPEHSPPPPAPKPAWQKYGTPLLVVLLAAAVVFTITRNWNSWEGGRIEQVTDDAYVRGNLTPLSTKVPGIVRDVKVSDYQQVHKGDLIVELEDDDYKAQVAQASAAVEAGKAAIENNRRQRELQDSKIDKALAGIDQAKAQITAAEAGIAAVQADVVRTQDERTRQEGLFQTRSTTQQKLEQAVADEQRFAAQSASRKADLEQAKTMLRSNELSAEAERRTKSVLESQDMQLVADLHAKEAGLTAAKVNLGYTTIEAPSDGTVGERQVRPGQLVSPGTQVIPFVDKIKWVVANYRETQLTNMKVGDPVEVRIDAYPGKTFRGKVIEIAPASGSQFALLPPDNATGNYTKVVQRIPVKIAFDDENVATSLQPGLSVIATVRTRH
ncbi:MAG TPA: HlyD family secretion protein [Candidatus Dormibacteraeota bacterium]|jgi:membrane fusion protein, multidrug efflux system|nr:HlyD family secretion protein [Candidatus Dormibacteraeota bacterium]